MASVGLPVFLAICECGELKIRETFWQAPYWTRYSPYIQEAKKMDLPKESCPLCGGDNKIFIGSYPVFSFLAAGLPQGA